MQIASRGSKVVLGNIVAIVMHLRTKDILINEINSSGLTPDSIVLTWSVVSLLTLSVARDCSALWYSHFGKAFLFPLNPGKGCEHL